MQSQIATVSSKGQLVIPAEIRASLGIQPGTRVSITVEGDRIILRPITIKLIDDLLGIFAGGPSMSDELIADRRAEDKKW
jgi:AbrB family looped-hinge helix DNA binding protein